MMKIGWVACLSLVAAMGSEAQGVPPANKVVEVTDPQYEMVAMRMSIPAGWRFAGTVARPQGCHANGPALKFTAASPDGSMGFSQMPGVQWTTGQQGLRTGCTPVNLQSASEFLINIAAPNLRPGSLVTAVLPATPEKAAQLAHLEQQRNAALNQMAAQYGQRNSSSFRAEGARVRVKYEAGGRPMEAQINAVVNCTESESPMGGRVRACTVEAISIGYAPAGQLETLLQSAFYTNIGREAQINSPWEQRLANESNNKFQGMMAGNAANQRNIMASGAAAGQARQQEHAAYMQQQAAHAATQQNEAQAQKELYANHNHAEAARQDAVHGQAQQVIRYAGDQALFKDPNTGQQIQANSSYNHQWMSGDGQTLLQTNDHAYDPNGRVGSQAWTELEPQ
jgi:hypothetical protein